MADLHGDGEIARGEFMRYFAEAVWYPTALLPSQGVRWEAVDDRSAMASMTDGPLTLTLLLRFGDDGLVASFRAEARGGMVGKVMVQAPWEGRFSNHQALDGMRASLSQVKSPGCGPRAERPASRAASRNCATSSHHDGVSLEADRAGGPT